jgi:hypothetical protein
VVTLREVGPSLILPSLQVEEESQSAERNTGNEDQRMFQVYFQFAYTAMRRCLRLGGQCAHSNHMGMPSGPSRGAAFALAAASRDSFRRKNTMAKNVPRIPPARASEAERNELPAARPPGTERHVPPMTSAVWWRWSTKRLIATVTPNAMESSTLLSQANSDSSRRTTVCRVCEGRGDH